MGSSSVQEGVHRHRSSGMVTSTRSRSSVNLSRLIGDRTTKAQKKAEREHRKTRWTGARDE
jgi:hypothetical protein